MISGSCFVVKLQLRGDAEYFICLTWGRWKGLSTYDSMNNLKHRFYMSDPVRMEKSTLSQVGHCLHVRSNSRLRTGDTQLCWHLQDRTFQVPVFAFLVIDMIICRQNREA